MPVLALIASVGPVAVELRLVRPEEHERAGQVVVGAYQAVPGPICPAATSTRAPHRDWLPVPDVPLLAFRLDLTDP